MYRLHKISENDFEKGYVSGAVYELSEELDNIYTTIMKLYSLSNPLHIELFPGVNKMEKEIIRMVMDLYCPDGYDNFMKRKHENHGILFKNDICGAFTSGGTESILLACKAHRDWFRLNKNVYFPEM